MDKTLILNSLQNHYNFNKDSDFARFLEISPQTLSNWKSRNTFDIDILYTKCVGVNPEWLLTGKGEMMKKEDQETALITQESQTAYQASNSNKLESRLLELLEQKDQEIAELKKELTHKNDLERQRMAESHKKLKK